MSALLFPPDAEGGGDATRVPDQFGFMSFPPPASGVGGGAGRKGPAPAYPPLGQWGPPTPGTAPGDFGPAPGAVGDAAAFASGPGSYDEDFSNEPPLLQGALYVCPVVVRDADSVAGVTALVEPACPSAQTPHTDSAAPRAC